MDGVVCHLSARKTAGIGRINMEKIIIAAIIIAAFLVLIRRIVRTFTGKGSRTSCRGTCDEASGCVCKGDENKAKDFFIRAIAMLGSTRR